jgi:hypothetical protein
VFARVGLPADHLVLVKGGHVMTRSERDALAQTLGPAEIQIAEDLFIGPTTPSERAHSMMYLNHACQPNLGVRGEIAFHTMAAVAADTELTLDYATADDDTWEMACACGSTACRGHVSGQDWRRPELQRRYQGWFAAYLHRKIAAADGS